MIAEFPNGWTLEIEHYPDRKKPLMVIRLDGAYEGHAVFKDEESAEALKALFTETWGDGRE